VLFFVSKAITLDVKRSPQPNCWFYVQFKCVVKRAFYFFFQVKIRILDSNDNIPRFLRTNDTNFIVTENVAGPFVATFKAEDSDSGINAKLSYSIVAGNENGTNWSIKPQA